MKRWVPIALALILVTIITSLALQAYAYPYILDDHDQWGYVQGFSSIQDCLSWDCYGLLRPAKNLIFYGIKHWADQSVYVSHSLCLGIYLFSTGLVGLWFLRWFQQRTWALMATMIWALSPTQVSSLIWLSCTNIVLAVGFVMAGLWCYDVARDKWDRSPKQSLSLWGLSILAYGIALFCYEGAIVLPALILLVDLARTRHWQKETLIAILPYFISALGFVILRWSVVPEAQPNNPAIHVTHDWQITAASAYFTMEHLLTWLAPWGRQEVLGTFIWGKTVSISGILLCWLLVILFIVQAFKRRQQCLEFSMGIVWFFIAFLPMSNLVPFKNGPFGDYYLVIPSIGLAMAVTGMLRQCVRYQDKIRANVPVHRLAMIMIISLIAWRVATVEQSFAWCHTWKLPEKLYYQSTQVRPYSFRARANLAIGFNSRGLTEEAKTQISECIDQAPWVPIHYNVLGDILCHEEAYDQACISYQQAIDLCDTDLYSHYALARTYKNYLDNPQAACDHYAWLIGRNWNRYSAEAAIQLSRLQYQSGDIHIAWETLQAANRRAPHADKISQEMYEVQRKMVDQLGTSLTLCAL